MDQLLGSEEESRVPKQLTVEMTALANQHSQKIATTHVPVIIYCTEFALPSPRSIDEHINIIL